MFARLRYRSKKTAQRFALGGIGAVMALSGIGFLSASALMLLLTLTDPITACAIMGGGFLGTGLLFMFAARTSQKPQTHHHAQGSQEAMPPVAAAFMQGMAQGMAAGRVKH